MKLFITGGAGFIGSNFIRYMLANYSDIKILNYDSLTYAGNLTNLDEINSDSRYAFVKGDITDYAFLSEKIRNYLPSAIIHFAAETHVDVSLENPQIFLTTNILGTENLLRCLKENSISKMVHISTDEVYGSLMSGEASESHPFDPNSPYSVSKASADMLCRAYHVSYGAPVTIIRGSNCFGPRQHPEKLIPKSLTNLLTGKPIGLYGDGTHIREWTFTEDFCRGVEAALLSGLPGEAYNLGAGKSNRVDNKVIAHAICNQLALDSNTHISFIKDRLGHDKRYALCNSKLQLLGWKPHHSLREGLEKTVRWYQDNEWWWKPLLET